MSTAVSVQSVRKAFDRHVAVDGVSFEIAPGTVYGLLGPNGAGKTTTIRMLMDIIRPDSGRVEILGGAPGAGALQRVGYLPEERGLYKKMKVIDVLVYLGSLKGLKTHDARTKALAWLEKVALGAWSTRKIEELSKGMAQKVQFVSCLLHHPELLILDEPFSGLDPVNANQLKDLFLEVSRTGTTIVFSTHQMETAERLCRSIALINKGKVVLEGDLAGIKERYGRNNVLLEFEGDGAFLRSLPAVKSVDEYGAYVELALTDGADPQQLLRAASEKLRVRRFEIVSPSLHNIFISLAGPTAFDPASVAEAEFAAAAAADRKGGAR